MSLGEVCPELNVDAWTLLQVLKDTNRTLSVSLEDMLDSALL